MAYVKEQKWAFTYRLTTANGNVLTKTCYPKTLEKVHENEATCKRVGYEIVSIKKLYPFSTMKNQHNFDLIHNIVMNDLYDYWDGDKDFSAEEVARLEDLRDKSEKFFSLPLPVAWLPYDEWKDAKELSEMAILHRQDACIENGRPDLVTYC